MNNVIDKIKKIADGINGNFASYSVKDALELLDGIIAQATKVNPETGKTLVFTGYIDGRIEDSVVDTKPNVNEYRRIMYGQLPKAKALGLNREIQRKS